MKYCRFIVLLAVLLIGCAKEEEPQFTTVRRILPIEGTYKGEITLRCDSLCINQLYSKNISISCLSKEEVLIDNQLFTGRANLSQLGDSYTYSDMYWMDYTNCDVEHPVSFLFKGSGHLRGDSLIQNGWFIAYKYGKKYSGKWSTRAVRLDSQ